MFELQYEPLIISEKLKPWEIAVIPWDTESFCFGVSTLNPSYDVSESVESAMVEKALRAYSKIRQVQVITTSIPSEQNATSFLLQRSGFFYIDLSLSIHYDNLKDISTKSPDGLSLSLATSQEVAGLVEMAGCSFQHGRYHQDLCFPRSLADQRYKDWLSRCLKPDSRQQILAAKFHDMICGFSVVERRNSEGYLHLHAIDSKWRGKKLGTGLILQSLEYLHNLGAETAGTKISASNLKALNMHSRLNGRFATANHILHWHRQEK